MTPPTAVREHLRQVRDDLREKRSERADAKRERDSAQEAFGQASHGDKPITEWPEFAAAEDATRKVGSLDDDINRLQIAETSILEMLGQAPESQSNGDHPALRVAQSPQVWSGGALLAGSEMYEEARKHNLFTSRNKFGTIQLGEIASREDAMQVLTSSERMAATGDLPTATAGVVDSTGTAPAIPQDRRGLISPLQIGRAHV